MKKWILKAVIQKAISKLPGSHKINYLFQKYITRGVQLSDDYFDDKLNHALDHLHYRKVFRETTAGFKALELGSGWYPIVPVALFLGGATEIVTVDITPLMKEKGVRQTLSAFLKKYKNGDLKKLQPFIIPGRLELLSEAEKASDYNKLLNILNLSVEIKDARNTGFDSGYFDLVCSNNVFEHIYPHILKDILTEFQRISAPGSVHSHFIDMSDHFAHLDKSISIHHFLKFSRRQWELIDNDVQPQNRLRYTDYLRLYQEMGLEIVDKKIIYGSTEVLAGENIHPDFQSCPPEEAAISHVHLAHKKAGGNL